MSATFSIRVAEFDVWRPGYAGAQIGVYLSGTGTLAALFLDPQLTTPAANPQTLGTLTDANGITYGKFAAPVYVGVPYTLLIDNTETTGVQRIPLYTLEQADASLAQVISNRAGAVPRTLRALGDDTIRVAAFGALGPTAAANTTILTTAIGACAAIGGGEVLVPEGTWPFTNLTLPANVLLVGAGRGVTVLQSQQASNVVTLGGNASGLRRLTLDGLIVAANSVGLFSIGRNDIYLDDVDVRRFATGGIVRGGTGGRFRDVFATGCTRGIRIRGDLDVGGTNAGSALRDFEWSGGQVSANTVAGVELRYEDARIEGASFENVWFDSNAGDAVDLVGARTSAFRSCRFTDNITHMRVRDGADASVAARLENTVRGLLMKSCHFTAGLLFWDGACEAVVYDNCTFEGASFNASVPAARIVMRDCRQDAATLSTGSIEQIMRSFGNDAGKFQITTTDNNYNTAWQTQLLSGEAISVRARVVGRQSNGINIFSAVREGTLRRPGATQAFDLASGTLSAGATVTGATSGATARVQAVVQSVASGTLTLRDIVGTFTSGEGLVFSTGQTAQASGTLLTFNAVAETQGAIGTPFGTDPNYDLLFDAAASQARVRVRGKTAHNVTWDVQVDVLTGTAI